MSSSGIRSSTKFTFSNDAGEVLAGRLEQPATKPKAWAVFAHCFTCSKNSLAAARVSRELCDRGFGVLRFDFTGLGASEGDFGNTTFSSNVADLVAAAHALGEAFEAPALLVGHSLGGAAAIMAAVALDSVRAVATIGAPSDPAHVTHLLGDRLDEIRSSGCAEVELAGRRFPIRREFLEDLEATSLAERLRRLGKAVLVTHSPIDEMVGVDHARVLYEGARHPKSFVSLDDADHLLTRPRDAAYAASVIAAWASRYLPEEEGEEEARADVAEGEVLVRDQGSGFTNDVFTAGHHWLADEPKPIGSDLGPNPYEMLLAALGACTSMTLRMYAARKKLALDSVEVTLRHSRTHAEDCADCEGEAKAQKVELFERDIRVRGDLDEATRAKLLEIADKCPVHRSLLATKQIPTRLVD